MSANIEADTKQTKVDALTRRIVDLERMVLRDERLTNNDHPLVQKAFKNVDSTFLIHSGAERNSSAFEQWLKVSKFTSESIKSARVGDK